MSQEALVREAFSVQSGWCTKLGSPFTARLMDVLGEHLDRQSATGCKILDWQGPAGAYGDAVPLRLAGALHALVRRGRLPQLAEHYPPNPLPSPISMTNGVMAAIKDADAEICEWLDHAPQTNEVARSAILYPGLMLIAAETRLPLALFELGASAGLNLISDKYAYRIGEQALGDPTSSVILSPNWSGSFPTGATPKILSRRGCDRNPIDVTDRTQRERLLGYVWPDQAERISRIEAAIEMVGNLKPQIDKSDAAEWVDDEISTPAEMGVVRVLYHSISFQYFPDDTKNRILSRMEIEGHKATPQAPLAWLAFEFHEDQGARLTLKLWPGGIERVIATADAHGREIQWLK